MEDTLTVRLSIEAATTGTMGSSLHKTFSVVTDVDKIREFKDWVIQYDNGTFDESGDLNCRTANEYKSCQLKATQSGFFPSTVKQFAVV